VNQEQPWREGDPPRPRADTFAADQRLLNWLGAMCVERKMRMSVIHNSKLCRIALERQELGGATITLATLTGATVHDALEQRHINPEFIRTFYPNAKQAKKAK
jgi:hypothetical protein